MQGETRTPTPSSYMIHPVAISIWLGLSILTALASWTMLSMFLGFLFMLSLCAFLWGRYALHRLEYTIKVPAAGVFPGQSVVISRTVRNNKLLPVIWLELMEPCDPQGCVVPKAQYIVANPEHTEAQGDKDTHCCLYAISLLKWHQKTTFQDLWTAQNRGIHRIPHCVLRSGDGFGLSAVSRKLTFAPPRQIVVYPRLVEVSIQRVLQDMWDSRSSSQGYLEDITLVRSVRDYQASDPARSINQRMLARGQGLKVNQYQVVTPNSVFFILDAASFQKAPPDDLEVTLSILASLITGLSDQGIQVGLAAGTSAYFPQLCVLPSLEPGETSRALQALAAAGAQDAALRGSLPYPAPELVGQVYYVASSLGAATSLPVLELFPHHKVQVMVCSDESARVALDYRVRPIERFRRVS